MENQKEKNNLLPASILIAAILIAGAVIYSTGAKKTETENKEINPQESAGVSKPQIDDDVVLGDPNAPVTIFIFSDYECPACGYFYQNIELLLKKDYIETKKIKLVHKDFPLENIHPLARPAAEAAECAKDQNKYWLYHDSLFEEQANLNKINFIDLAIKLGLKKEEFEQCHNSRKYKDEVTADYNEGLKLNVDATPTIFIEEKMFRGAPSYEIISQTINELLNK